ncbi:hypothetical protein RMN57_35845 [Kitasatospora sp. CM 4170]|uniref:non-specific serine/threonine protein kinase n=1 Tax=Kitasatospora aburaviensis TaxID=67265 RepID=A0ABW1F195_9ACTN|nr:hypothetical protein [Kitasatospora sp. CM 4170]WNM49696.1 hypothetical protein RMN57_35845 [Kitasatospora sp. CM 4170]
MADGTTAEPGAAGGGRERPGVPRTKVDRLLRGRRGGGRDGSREPSSRLGIPTARPATGAVPNPPTRVLPDAPTRVTPPDPGATAVPAPPAAPPSAPPAGAAPGRGGQFGGAFPAALLDRYEPLGVAGSGTEGTVWHVRRTDGGGDAAVKVTVAGQAMDPELLEHLRDDGYRRHVPLITGHGRVEHAGARCDWVAMEYLPVTLADHFAELRRAGRAADGTETERIVRELVALLDFWQQRIRRNPVDFKPSNILLRPTTAPDGAAGAPEFVIADFGGVARLTASRSFSPEMQVTVAYMAPEQLAGTNRAEGPWWALGNVLYELFTGRPRYLDADGLLLSDEVLQYDLVMAAEVDLSGVAHPRRQLLLQGLFTRNPAHRWTAPQVRTWLAGGSPEVVRPAVPPGGAPVAPAHRPITFLGDLFHDPAALAVAMLGRSADAAHWLARGGAQRLREWLSEDVRDTVVDLSQLRDVERLRGPERAAAAAVAVLAFGAAFAPGAVPSYRNRPIDSAGLARLAADPGLVALVDELIAGSVPAVAARYDCDHPECFGEQCARLLALAELPAVLAGVEEAAREVGGGRRGGDGLSADERAEAYRLVVLLTVRAEEHPELVARLSPLPAVLHRLAEPALLSTPVAVASAVAVNAALAARTAVRREAPDPVRRRWSALRRRAVGADPATVPGRAALVAAAVLRARTTPTAGPNGRRPPARRDWLDVWWSNARTALPRQAGAVALVTLALALMLWSGAVWRFAVDARAELLILPNGGFGGPLRGAGEHAARQVVGQLGAALVTAVVAAVFPARVGRWTLLLAAAAAFAVGYLRLGPPMTFAEPPQALADRIVVFEGGLGSWAGVAAALVVVLAVFLVERAATGMLKPVHEARGRTAREWRRLAARRRPAGAGSPEPAPEPDPARWRPGRAGLRDRVLYALGTTHLLVVLLWATVEVRLAATGHHPTPASWGTGQAGAGYQADFALLFAALAVLSTLATPRTARRLLGLWVVGAMVLGSWPPPLGPLEALRIPVARGQFGAVAEFWGHGAFWAALLVALPVVGLGVLRTVRRTMR